MAWVYILKSSRGKYYIGSTKDLHNRLQHHKSGHTPTTRRMKDVSLALSQEYNTLEEARAVERKLKSLKRKDYIEKITQDGYIKIEP